MKPDGKEQPTAKWTCADFSWPLLRPCSRPLLALVLAQTLRHGPREGCKIALTPLVTDAPIILVALVVAAKLAQLSPAIDRVVRRCLEKQADRRFQSASDLAFDIEGAGAAPTTVERSTPERRIKKALLVAVALAVVALGGIGIWLYHFSGRLPKVESKSVAVLPFVNMSADKDNEYLSDGITQELIAAITTTLIRAELSGIGIPQSAFMFMSC